MWTIVTDPGGRPGPSFLVQCLELSDLCRVTNITLRLRQTHGARRFPCASGMTIEKLLGPALGGVERAYSPSSNDHSKL
jgi:hypothetical protein